MTDNVNHPLHYKSNGIEVIDVIEAFELGYCLGNVTKYVLRAGRKENAVEDLKKAAWYLAREIDQLSSDCCCGYCDCGGRACRAGAAKSDTEGKQSR